MHENASIAKAIGVVTVDDFRPYAWVLGGDGNVWVRWVDGAGLWHWSNQGSPPSARIVAPIGVTTTPGSGGRPYAFVTGSDGNLWAHWWNGSAWSWTNVGPTPSVSSGVGVTMMDGRLPHVFLISGETLHLCAMDKFGNWHWANLGRSPLPWGGVIGVIAPDGRLPAHVFLTAGALVMMNRWDGVRPTWTESRPPEGQLTGNWVGVAVAGAAPVAFLQGAGSNGLVAWTGSAWSSLGLPEATTWREESEGIPFSAIPFGAVSLRPNKTAAFVAGADGNFWINSWDGAQSTWTNAGRPSSSRPSGPIGAGALGGTNPYCFVRGDDGNLWLSAQDSAGNWTWSNHQKPGS